MTSKYLLRRLATVTVLAAFNSPSFAQLASSTNTAYSIAKGNAQGLIDNYQNLLKTDPNNATQWAFCASAAYALAKMSEEQFAIYARRTVATLKQTVTDKTKCPCKDVLLGFWDEYEYLAGHGKDPNTAVTGPPAAVAKKPEVKVVSAAPAPQLGSVKSVAGHSVRVKSDQIPGFVPGTSTVIPGTVRASYRGLYVAYLPTDGMNSPIETRIYKSGGGGWTKSVQKAAVTSIWLTKDHDREGRTELSYTWTGAPAPTESVNDIIAQNSATMASTSNLGSYTNNGTPFSNDNPPTLFFKIAGDKSDYALWGIGGPPPEEAANYQKSGHIYLYRENRSVNSAQGRHFDRMDVNRFLTSFDVIMEGAVRKGDIHVWIAKDDTLYKVTPQGSAFAFKALDFPAPISKIRVTEDYTWVLAGDDLYRIGRNDIPTKFYTITTNTPSFAVDANYVYANDGNAISLSHQTRRLFLGSGSTFQGLGALEIECAVGEHTLYMVDVSSGKVYSVQTY